MKVPLPRIREMKNKMSRVFHAPPPEYLSCSTRIILFSISRTKSFRSLLRSPFSRTITSPRSRRAFNGFLVTADVLITIKKSSRKGANAALSFCSTEARRVLPLPSLSRLRETWRNATLSYIRHKRAPFKYNSDSRLSRFRRKTRTCRFPPSPPPRHSQNLSFASRKFIQVQFVTRRICIRRSTRLRETKSFLFLFLLHIIITQNEDIKKETYFLFFIFAPLDQKLD